MSNVLMEQPPSSGQYSPPAVQPAEAPQAAEGNNFDIVQILWRWKWLPILGSIVGACLGFLYFSRQPATFEAAALVQVVNSMPAPTKNDFYNLNEMTKVTRVDESMVIRSQAVLRRSVELGKLSELPDFLGLQTDEIVAMLMDEDESTLVIEPADKDDSTTLITISYVSEDAEVAAKVVTSIVAGYEDYLDEEYETNGDEIANLIRNAQEQLSNTFKELNVKNLQFMTEAPDVIWAGDEATDPYAQEYMDYNKQLLQVRVERSKLESVYNEAIKALESGRPAEAVMAFLMEVGNDRIGTDSDTWYGRFQFEKEQREALQGSEPQSVVLERTSLFPLMVRESVLLDSLSPKHPTVTTIQKEIQLVKQQIETLRETEREQDMLQAEQQAQLEQSTGVKIVSVGERLDIKLKTLADQIASLRTQEQGIAAITEESQAKSRELQLMLGEHRILNSEIEAARELLTGYTEKLQEVNLMPKIGQRTLKKLNMPAMGWFYGPKILPYLLGGAAVGFILLSGLAVLMDLADRSYRNPSEISTDLGVNVLGHIPVMNIAQVKKKISGVDPAIACIHHGKGRVAEAYRSVRTGLYFSNKGKTLKVLQVTSPVPGDGKSTLSANIAVTMAQSGRNVLLIDADLRRPRVAKIFGIDSEVGVAAVVANKIEVEDAIHAGPIPNLSILPGGKRPSNPAEILSSQRFANMIDMLRDKFDVIVIDTPPLLAVSDPGAVAGIVDGVVMTMRLRRNVKPLAMRAKSILGSVGANLLGVVINGVSSEAGYGYNYDYNDYRYAYKYGSNYRSGYGYRYGYGNYRYGYTEGTETDDLGVPAVKNEE